MTFHIFVSYVDQDKDIAKFIHDWLKMAFKDCKVFYANGVLHGGKIWIEEIREQLKISTAIIALITPNSFSSKWVYFEAGAGFTDRKTIPLCCGGISVDNLDEPLTLIQSRDVTKHGLLALKKDIEQLAGIKEPKRVDTNLILDKIQNVIKHREELKSNLNDIMAPESKVIREIELDLKIKNKMDMLENDVLEYLSNNVEKGIEYGIIPKDIEIQGLSMRELFDIVFIYNYNRDLLWFQNNYYSFKNKVPLKDMRRWERDRLLKEYTYAKELFDSLEDIF